MASLVSLVQLSMIKQKMARIEYASDARSQLRSYFAYSYCSEKAVIRQSIGITAPAKHGGWVQF